MHQRLRSYAAAVCVLWTLVGAAAQAAPKDTRPKVAVMGVAVQSASLEAGMAGTMEALIVDALNATHRFLVTGRSDMGAVLGLEAQKQALGCDADANCMAEIAAALGVDYVLTASVGKIGSKYILRAGLVDVKAQRAVAAASRKLDNDSAIADAIDPWISDLVEAFNKQVPAPKTEPRPPAKPEPKAEPKPEPKPEPRPAPKPEPAPEPKPEPAAARGTSPYRCLGKSCELILLGAWNPLGMRWAGLVLVGVDLGAEGEWTLAAGAMIAPVPSLRIAAERRLVRAGVVDVRLALRGLAANLDEVRQETAFGGGLGLVVRLPVTAWLDLQAGAAADAIVAPEAFTWAPYAELGIRGHL